MYEYRQVELQKTLSLIMATMARLDSVVTRMETVADAAEVVAVAAEKFRSNWWLRIGVCCAMLGPLGAVLIEKLWR